MLTINTQLYKSMYIVGLESLLFKGLPFVLVYKNYSLYTTPTNGIKDNEPIYSTCRNQLAFDIRVIDINTKEKYGFIALKQSRINCEEYLKIKDLEPIDKAKYILSTDPRSIIGQSYLVDDFYGTLNVEEELTNRLDARSEEAIQELEKIKNMSLVRNKK